MEENETKPLLENAYSPLEPGKSYEPLVPAGASMPEVTWRSVCWGILFCIIFTVASAYSGLKVGQVMEAAIPISILAIGLARLYRRRSTVLENVIITGIGGVSGSVVAGDPRVVLPAPQASIMKALVEGFMSYQPVAYILFGAGVMTALIMEMLGVPALVFALGMYLPLELNTPGLVGGFLAHWIGRKSDRIGGRRGSTMRERAAIIASGLMAGGALGGVFGAALRLFPWYNESKIKTPFYDNEVLSQSISAILFVGLCLYLWFNSVRRVKED